MTLSKPSDLQLGDKKVTLNYLEHVFWLAFVCVCVVLGGWGEKSCNCLNLN